MECDDMPTVGRGAGDAVGCGGATEETLAVTGLVQGRKKPCGAVIHAHTKICGGEDSPVVWVSTGSSPPMPPWLKEEPLERIIG
jgi:hypothetical protein